MAHGKALRRTERVPRPLPLALASKMRHVKSADANATSSRPAERSYMYTEALIKFCLPLALLANISWPGQEGETRRGGPRRSK